MDYNFYLFGKLADLLSPEVQAVDEIDLKYDILVDLYAKYNKSPYPAMMRLSDYEAMSEWFKNAQQEP